MSLTTDNPFIYDTLQYIVHLGRIKVNRIIEQEVCFNSSPDDKILDLGCGTGHMTRLFPKKCYHGIDISSRYIDYARNKWPGYNFSLMDGKKIDYPDGYFNWITTVFTFHHIEDHVLLELLSEVNRCLKQDGKILVIDTIIPQRINIFGRLLVWLDNGKWTRNRCELERIASRVLNIDKKYQEKVYFAGLFLTPIDICVMVLSKKKVPKTES